MIDAIAKRRMKLNGTTYQKGNPVKLPLDHFNELEPTGLIERAPVEVAKPAPKPTKSSTSAD